MRLEEEVGNLLQEKGLTVGVVESATGGLISHLITNVPGSSAYYKGSVTSYSNNTKINVVGVKAETIKRYGAVSPQVAREMAKDGRKLLGVDICVADTGIAGPDGATHGKPVGLFYLGLSAAKGTYSRKRIFSGDREHNKRQAARAALVALKSYLLHLKNEA
ncbi:MAG: CinA family protein [Dehalococcoidales bacterium]|nr:CinA family protein [Dehalococcoidales bacterium]